MGTMRATAQRDSGGNNFTPKQILLLMQLTDEWESQKQRRFESAFVVED